MIRLNAGKNENLRMAYNSEMHGDFPSKLLIKT